MFICLSRNIIGRKYSSTCYTRDHAIMLCNPNSIRLQKIRKLKGDPCRINTSHNLLPLVYKQAFFIEHGNGEHKRASKHGGFIVGKDDNDISDKKIYIIRMFSDGNLSHYLDSELLNDHRYIDDMINITTLALYYKHNDHKFTDIFTEIPFKLTEYGNRLLVKCGVQNIYTL